MRVELLYFEGCPSYQAFLPRLRELLTSAGVAGAVQLRRIESDADATAARFLGSPTVRVEGVDVEPGADRRDDFGMKCRLYRTPDGLSGTPAEQWVIDALATGPDDAAA